MSNGTNEAANGVDGKHQAALDAMQANEPTSNDEMNRTRASRRRLTPRFKTSGENELDFMHTTLTRMWWTLTILVVIVLLEFFVVLTVIREPKVVKVEVPAKVVSSLW